MNTSVSPVGMSQSVRRSASQRFKASGLSSSVYPFSSDLSARWSRRASDGNPVSQSVSQPRTASLTSVDTYKGKLELSDRAHPNRRDHVFDVGWLPELQAGQTVQLSLRSRAFDPLLELVDARKDRVLAVNDDRNAGDRSSFISFTVEKGIDYRVRVTSFDAEATGRYVLKVESAEGGLPTFDFKAGYGLVDAAAAVAAAAIDTAAVRKSLFAELPNTSDLWGLNAINAPEAWANGFTGKGVTVAVLDTGVNYRHKDLKSNIWKNTDEIAGNGIDDDKNGYVDDVRGWKFVDDDSNDPNDFDGHGTHVAGTIAGLKNDFGVTGVAYNAKIMPVKVIDGRDDYSTFRFDQNLAAGIRYAVDNGARVLNMSLGAFPGEDTLIATKKALKYAKNAGAVVVMAAGNDGRKARVNGPNEPALFAKDGLGIAVGAIREGRKMAGFSNPAGDASLPFIDGPGVGVKSTVLGNRYAFYSGTSMASPHVAGVVALMLSANPDLTPDQVRQILIKTANPDGVLV